LDEKKNKIVEKNLKLEESKLYKNKIMQKFKELNTINDFIEAYIKEE